jgi:alpha-D-ribose 1-methylphosphonate 5-triphosphate synthase subunit PhnH
MTLPASVHLDAPLGEAAAALALTLLDYETPVWLDGALKAAASYLRFHCNAPLADAPSSSRFAFAANLVRLPPLDAFDLGKPEYPDRSTTLILEAPALTAGTGLRLRGPGIQDEAMLAVGGLSAKFWAARSALAELFPLGLDLVLTSGRSFAALPRSTMVEA